MLIFRPKYLKFIRTAVMIFRAFIFIYNCNEGFIIGEFLILTLKKTLIKTCIKSRSYIREVFFYECFFWKRKNIKRA